MSDEVRIYSGKLYPWQVATAKMLLAHPYNLILSIIAPRQVGKTHFIEMYTLSRVINRNKFRTVIVNPTFANSVKTYGDFMGFLRQIPGDIVESANESRLTIKFTNGSSIQLKSIEQGDALRGDNCNLLILDEAAFLDANTAMRTLFPYVNATHGTIVLISTPKFKSEDNLFYRFYDLGLRRGKNEGSNVMSLDWRKYNLSEVLTEERKELLRETMPYNIFANEILGEFLTEKNDLWDIAPVLRNGILPTDDMFGGLDWGSSGTDETVLPVFNRHRQMYRLYRWGNDTPATELVSRIIDVCLELKLKKVVYEANSIGTPLATFLKREAAKRHCQTMFISFNTDNKGKRRIIESLQLAIENQTVTLLDDPTLKLQFLGFAMKQTKTGQITYGNSSDSVHDDIVLATALALEADVSGNYVLG